MKILELDTLVNIFTTLGIDDFLVLRRYSKRLFFILNDKYTILQLFKNNHKSK